MGFFRRRSERYFFIVWWYARADTGREVVR